MKPKKKERKCLKKIFCLYRERKQIMNENKRERARAY